MTEASKRRGRPPRTTGPTDHTSVRLSEEERSAFAAAAGDAPVSVWLRGLGRVAVGLDKRKR